MAHIAFVTDEKYADLEAEDRVLALALQSRGHRVSPAIWSDPAVAWTAFDHIIVRTPWDYFVRVQEFNHWLDALEAAFAPRPVPILNPLDVLRWNQDKRYLRQLAQKGVPIIPTLWVEAADYPHNTPPPLATLLDTAPWLTNEVVLKPAVSGGGRGTYRFAVTDAPQYQQAFQDIVAESAALVQPFLPQVQTDGEWTFMYFNGRFSHAVRKLPKPGNFLVQHTQGGSKQLDTPPAALRAGADAVMAALPAGLLYARIDGLNHNGQFLLMEAELLEPYFYTFGQPGIVSFIADAIEAAIA